LSGTASRRKLAPISSLDHGVIRRAHPNGDGYPRWWWMTQKPAIRAVSAIA